MTNAATLSEPQSTIITLEYLKKMDAYWRAANYLSVGQMYLYGNPLLREPLTLDYVKRLVDDPIQMHVNEVLEDNRHGQDMPEIRNWKWSKPK